MGSRILRKALPIMLALRLIMPSATLNATLTPKNALAGRKPIAEGIVKKSSLMNAVKERIEELEGRMKGKEKGEVEEQMEELRGELRGVSEEGWLAIKLNLLQLRVAASTVEGRSEDRVEEFEEAYKSLLRLYTYYLKLLVESEDFKRASPEEQAKMILRLFDKLMEMLSGRLQ